jgi:hypothetical protein
MKNGLIVAVAAAGCILGFQVSALAQDLAEHPPFAAPSGPSVAGTVYNFYGPSAQCYGTYDPYNGNCYPPDFQGPWH